MAAKTKDEVFLKMLLVVKLTCKISYVSIPIIMSCEYLVIAKDAIAYNVNEVKEGDCIVRKKFGLVDGACLYPGGFRIECDIQQIGKEHQVAPELQITNIKV